jgi:hypothetical protein
LALRVDILILPIIGNGSPPVHFLQKYFGIERELPFAFHSRPSLRRSSFEDAGHFTASLQEGTIAFRSAAHPSKRALGPAVDIFDVRCWRCGHFNRPLR